MSDQPKWIERFMANVEPEPNSGCWLWTGSAARHGYGSVRYLGRQRVAHRVAFEMFRGKIPQGSYVLHRCDNPACVNPDHLFTGDQSANIRDCITKGRHNYASRSTCVRGHSLVGARVKVVKVGGRTRSHRVCRECVRLRSLARRDAERLARNGGVSL